MISDPTELSCHFFFQLRKATHCATDVLHIIFTLYCQDKKSVLGTKIQSIKPKGYSRLVHQILNNIQKWQPYIHNIMVYFGKNCIIYAMQTSFFFYSKARSVTYHYKEGTSSKSEQSLLHHLSLNVDSFKII